jgi:hypothetical protein
MSRDCLNCGMRLSASMGVCPKCDAIPDLQTDGSVLHHDIAHQHETVAIALQKMARVLEEGRMGYACAVRLVVGRGLIRDEVMRQLSWLAMRGEILEFDHDAGNTGAILVTLRRQGRRSAT